MAWEAALPSGEPGLVDMEALLKGLVMDSEGLVDRGHRSLGALGAASSRSPQAVS